MLSFTLQKEFESFSLDVTLTVENEIMVLLAPSGGGKSLTLNLISGIVGPDSGKIQLDETILYDSSRNIFLPIRKRSIGYIFQDYTLFPNKTVQQNIAFGMPKRARSDANFSSILKKFNLEDKAHAHPHQLSGGQKQRVAIARALAARSRVLLFDEPLSAVDVQLRESLIQEIGEIPTHYSLPVLYVTHNFREAEQLADRIAVMNGGKIVEFGEKNAILRKPHKYFTAQFLGMKNLFDCTNPVRIKNRWNVKIFNTFTLEIDSAERHFRVESAWLGIHPKDVRLIVTDEERPNMLTVHVEDMRITDRVYRVILQVLQNGEPVPDFKLTMDIDELTCRKYNLALHDTVRVSLKPDRMFLCD